MLEVMAVHRKVWLICAHPTLICSIVALGVVALSDSSVHAGDCLGRFPEGRFGIPLSHPVVVSGTLAVEGFSPLYLTKQPVSVSEEEICNDVSTADVFRMVGPRGAGRLL